jgi:hypothetical protein
MCTITRRAEQPCTHAPIFLAAEQTATEEAGDRQQAGSHAHTGHQSNRFALLNSALLSYVACLRVLCGMRSVAVLCLQRTRGQRRVTEGRDCTTNKALGQHSPAQRPCRQSSLSGRHARGTVCTGIHGGTRRHVGRSRGPTALHGYVCRRCSPAPHAASGWRHGGSLAGCCWHACCGDDCMCVLCAVWKNRHPHAGSHESPSQQHYS